MELEKLAANQSPKLCAILDLQCLTGMSKPFDFLDHWVDVFQNGIRPDVKRVYQNADAVVGPGLGNVFYEEIQEAFPDCKVILSIREEDSLKIHGYKVL